MNSSEENNTLYTLLIPHRSWLHVAQYPSGDIVLRKDYVWSSDEAEGESLRKVPAYAGLNKACTAKDEPD